MLKKNQKGFSAVEVVLVLVILALIGTVGFMVYRNHHKITASSTKTELSATTTFSDEGGLYNFQLPKSWTTEYPAGQTGSAKEFLTIKPNNFTAPGQENNWLLGVTVMPIPGGYADGTQFATFEEFKKITLEQTADNNPVSKDLVINGTPVWEFDETIQDISATGPPELSGGYHDLNYYYHKGSQRIIRVSMRVYQHATTNYLGTKINSSYDYTKYVPEFQAIAQSLKLNY